MQKIPMTKEGYMKLQEELDHLKKVERPQALQALNEAAALGDITDNADYRVAKERRDYIENKIKELDDKLARAQIIDPKEINTDKVVFGCTVLLGELETEKQVRYKIVGADEADIKNGRISINSPVAKALIGRSVGDIVTVHVPSGKKEFEILEITAD